MFKKLKNKFQEIGKKYKKRVETTKNLNPNFQEFRLDSTNSKGFGVLGNCGSISETSDITSNLAFDKY